MNKLKTILADKWLNIACIITNTLFLESKWSKHDYDWYFWLGITFMLIYIPLTIIEIIKEYKVTKK